ncbi:MAG: hypothetical protein BWY83_01842 [bacterium ADurb.Bin478]|nr:MAG: hypothetical protein BWY83_01842 [bacterium ADurb.Bin478]
MLFLRPPRHFIAGKNRRSRNRDVVGDRRRALYINDDSRFIAGERIIRQALQRGLESFHQMLIPADQPGRLYGGAKDIADQCDVKAAVVIALEMTGPSPMFGRNRRSEADRRRTLAAFDKLGVEQRHIPNRRIDQAVQSIGIRIIFVSPPQRLHAKAVDAQGQAPGMVQILPSIVAFACLWIRRLIGVQNMRIISPVHPIHLLSQPGGARQIVKDQTVIGLGQLGVIGRRGAPISLLKIVIGVIVSVPGGRVVDEPGEQSHGLNSGFAETTQIIE